MNRINLNKIDTVIKDLKESKVLFEVDPLDIGITKIQMNLLKNGFERKVPEYGDFAPVYEKFESKNPDRNLSDIKVSCSNIKEKMHRLELKIMDKNQLNEYIFVLKEGSQQELKNFIDSKKFFETCKNVILSTEEIIASNKNKI